MPPDNIVGDTAVCSNSATNLTVTCNKQISVSKTVGAPGWLWLQPASPAQQCCLSATTLGTALPPPLAALHRCPAADWAAPFPAARWVASAFPAAHWVAPCLPAPQDTVSWSATNSIKVGTKSSLSIPGIGSEELSFEYSFALTAGGSTGVTRTFTDTCTAAVPPGGCFKCTIVQEVSKSHVKVGAGHASWPQLRPA